MSIQVIGVIEYQDFGTGTWALVTEQGVTYELLDAPVELQKVGLKVNIKGQERPDVMSLAMIGPILEVLAFSIQD